MCDKSEASVLSILNLLDILFIIELELELSELWGYIFQKW